MSDLWAYCDHCNRWYSSHSTLATTPPCPACDSPPSRISDRPVAPMPR